VDNMDSPTANGHYMTTYDDYI